MSPEKTPLVSIERIVAFVVGPVVIAGSGTLSAWLSTKVGIKVSAPEITGAFATGGLAAGALAWTWLKGRQIPLLAQGQQAVSTAENALSTLGVSKGTQDGVIHIAEEDLKRLLEDTAQKAVDAIHGGKEYVAKPEFVVGGPIPAAANDPAPSTPVQAEPAPSA